MIARQLATCKTSNGCYESETFLGRWRNPWPTSDEDTTRATAHLPGLEIEIVHRRHTDNVEQISINLHVVIAHPAADDQHPFIAQGCEGLAKPDMFCGIHAGQQRDLHNRQIGSREDHLQWNENTVIEATEIVIFPGNLLSAQQFGNALSEVRSSRRRKGNRIGARWKPVVVIEQRWGRIVLEQWRFFLPNGRK